MTNVSHSTGAINIEYCHFIDKTQCSDKSLPLSKHVDKPSVNNNLKNIEEKESYFRTLFYNKLIKICVGLLRVFHLSIEPNQCSENNWKCHRF